MTDAPDLLYGVKAIADHIGIEEKAARHRIEKRQIPTFKMGAIICSTRTELRDWMQQELADARKAAAAGAAGD